MAVSTEALTYGELDRRAESLAAELRRRGVRRGARVGVAARRCGDMVAAVLAALKAGAAYVPLDPSYPRERLAFMLEDAGLELILAHDSVAEELPARCPVLSLDRAWDEERQDPSAHETVSRDDPSPHDAPSPHDDAYVLYTSGSTGRPKGVVMPHGPLVNLVRWHLEHPELSRPLRTAQFASLSFDVAFQEMLTTLACGGELVLVPEDTRRDMEALAAFLEEHGVERLFVPFSVLEPLCGELTRQGLGGGLRQVITAGEALRFGGQVAAFFTDNPRCQLHNHYGPTETHVVTAHRVLPAAAPPPLPPIGRTIAGVRVHVVDEALRRVPRGVAGELVLGGLAPARGYLDRPALTAERFVADPFSDVEGARLYRSGDLARWNARGELEFLGRLDDQVKVRGVRVELGEIEAALGAWPGASRVAVLVVGEASSARLVAFLTAADDRPLDVGAARDFLSARLPEAMVPASFLEARELPVTANGKLDRRRLEALAAERLDAGHLAAGHLGATGAPSDAPVGVEEELLRGLFAEVLGVAPRSLGRGAHFFELGGHSLSATRLAALVRRTFGVELPLREVFARPTVTSLAALLPELKASSPALEAPRRRTEAESGTPAPLSFAQERLWFLDRLEGPSATYNLALALRLEAAERSSAGPDPEGPGPEGPDLAGPDLEGPALDIAALEAALGAVVARHDVLRTRFVTAGEDRPVQVVEAAGDFRLDTVDLRHLPRAEAEREATRLVDTEAATLFDLAASPPLRCRLLRVADEVAVLCLTLHHIAGDGWSFEVLARELADGYRRFAAEDPRQASGGPPPLALQYADYAAWQRATLDGAALGEQLDFWRRELEGAPESLDLPTRHPRPARQSYRGASYRFEVPAGLVEGLRDLARQARTTLFLTLEAAFSELLGRYAGSRDVCVGTPVANRRHVELEPLIGLFVNTVVLRHRLDGDESVRRRLESVRETALGAFAHQDAPFEQVVEALNPTRDPSRSPVFQVLFTYQAAPVAPVAPVSSLAPGDAARGRPGRPRLPGLRVAPLEPKHEVSRLDLSLAVAEKPSGELAAAFEYASDLFDAPFIEQLARHFLNLLGAFARSPDQPVSRLSLFSAEEERRMLEWGRGLLETSPREADVLERFRAQASARPGAMALIVDGDIVTYRDLESRAERLAGCLGRLGGGTGPGTLVGLALPRSEDMVVALLAVVGSGAAYLPLDPSLPEARLRFMIEDSGCDLVLVDRSTRQEVEALLPPGVRLLDLDAERGAINESGPIDAEAEETVERAGRSLDRLAYVIYTSGSTGRPKGVEVTHRSLAAFLDAMATRPGLDRDDVLLAVTTLSFDIAALEIFLPLSVGARVVLARREDARDGRRLLGLLESSGATVLQATPATWRLLLAAGLGSVPRLKMLCGGEALAADLARDLRARGRELWNLYGPTETTIWSSVAAIEDEVHLGHPLPGTRLEILDREGRPTPPGIPGELHIAGLGLARGYRGRPALTAERFVPDIRGAQAEPGARMYRTGDLVTWRLDEAGEPSLHYLGRLDHQVKIRGHRIEPGEIEAALESRPEVAEALVSVETVEEEPRLVAYLRLESEPPEDDLEAVLREHLAHELPAVMVPAEWVIVQGFPLTPSGKVDRAALAHEATTRRRDGTGQGGDEAPRTALEKAVAGAFAKLLGVSSLGRGADFFALGGHSLLAVRLAAELERRTGRPVPVSSLFQHPEVASLASSLEAVEKPSPLVELRPGQLSGEGRALYLVHELEGLATTYRPLVERLTTPRQVMGLECAGLRGEIEPLRTVEGLASSYAAALEAHQPEGPFTLAGWSFGGLVALEMARELRRRGRQVEEVVLVDAYAPDLARRLTPERRDDKAPESAPARVLAANRRAMETFRPEPYDATLDVHLLRAEESFAEDVPADLGWGELITGRLRLTAVDGDHRDLVLGEEARVVAEMLDGCL